MHNQKKEKMDTMMDRNNTLKAKEEADRIKFN